MICCWGITPKASKRRSVLQGVTGSAGRLWKHSNALPIIRRRLTPRGDVKRFFTLAPGQKPVGDGWSSYYHCCAKRVRSSGSGLAPSRWKFGGVRSVTYRARVVLLRPLYGPICASAKVVESKQTCFAGSSILAGCAAIVFDHLGFDLTLPRENTSDRAAGYQGY